MIPMVTTPHLIGKHPQHEDSLVNSLAHTQSQQQHGSKIGLAYGSSPVSSFLSSSFLPSDFLPADFLAEPEDLASSGLSAASASLSPPSNRYAFSSSSRLYFLVLLLIMLIIFIYSRNNSH